MRCWNCGHDVPEGAAFCPQCGARQGPGHEQGQPQHPAHGTRNYAANPYEHLYHPSIVSTLSPHLAPRGLLLARWLLFVLVVVIFLIGLGRFAPLAIVLAALLLPALYLLYFYQAQIYEDEPWVVLAATFLAGAVLGILLSLVSYYPLLAARRHVLVGTPSPGYVLLTGVVVPIVAQALMLVGPLVLYRIRPRFDEVLDGLAFGVASGLGFAATQNLIYSWQLLTSTFQQRGPALTWALPTIRVAVLVPVLDAATTGLICAALWLRRDPAAPRRWIGALETPVVAVVASLLLQVLPSLLSDFIGGLVMPLVWYGLAAVVALLLLRRELHLGLVEKGRPLGHGAEAVCPQCGHHIGDVAFCPYCGLALRATTKRWRRGASQAQKEPGQEAEREADHE